jgi:hypothetical protein
VIPHRKGPSDSPCAELPHTSVGDQTLTFPQRWSQVGPSYKKKKLPPSLPLSFAFNLLFTTPSSTHSRHTPCRPRLSPLALGRRTLRRSILPIPP